MKSFRPIALLSRLHKLWTKWLGKKKGELTALWGRRAHRQALEVIYSMLRIAEIAREWGKRVLFMRLDWKSFDRVLHTAIICSLKPWEPPLVLSSLCRERMTATLMPNLHSQHSTSTGGDEQGNEARFTRKWIVIHCGVMVLWPPKGGRRLGEASAGLPDWRRFCSSFRFC